MLQYLITRLILLVPILLGVALFSFLIIHFIPGDPAQVLAGMRASEADIELFRIRLGLDRPLHIQFLDFIRGLFVGNLGTSIRTRRPVAEELRERFFATSSLAILAITVSIIISIPLGIFAATKQYSIYDSITMFFAIFGLSAPGFWLGLMLMYFLAYRVQLFPPSGMYGPPWTWDGLLSYVLPTITLSISSTAVLARLTRSSILEILLQDFIRTARSKGLGERIVLYRHALRNALIPVVTLAGIQLGYLLGGAVVVETVFSWPGFGRYVVTAIHYRDIPVVQGGIMLFALTFVLINLFVDILYAYIDPRIRYE